MWVSVQRGLLSRLNKKRYGRRNRLSYLFYFVRLFDASVIQTTCAGKGRFSVSKDLAGNTEAFLFRFQSKIQKLEINGSLSLSADMQGDGIEYGGKLPVIAKQGKGGTRAVGQCTATLAGSTSACRLGGAVAYSHNG